MKQAYNEDGEYKTKESEPLGIPLAKRPNDIAYCENNGYKNKCDD